METPPGKISELPLFPLDLVLFPNVVEPLHIFEPRYRTLVQRCLKDNLPFGIVLATGTNARTGSVETAPIGCMARIIESEPLDDGRYNIQVLGGERFRILDTHDAEPYLTGLIEPLDDTVTDNARWQPLLEGTQEILREYLTLQVERIGRRNVRFDLPTEPLQLSFLASRVLPISNSDKQIFLELTDTPSRLLQAKDVLRRAVAQLRQLIAEENKSPELVWKALESDHFKDYRCPN